MVVKFSIYLNRHVFVMSAGLRYNFSCSRSYPWPHHAKTCLRVYADSEISDQPACPCSLVRLHCMLTESLDTTESMNGEQRPV